MNNFSLFDNIGKSCHAALNFEKVNGRSSTVSVSGLQLSSRHNPEDEAYFQAANILISDTIYLYGIGLGYLPEELIKRHSLKTLHVKIMNFKLFLLILGLRDQGVWLKDKRVKISLATIEINTDATLFVFPPDLILADDARERTKNVLASHLLSNVTKNQFKENDPVLRTRLKQNYAYLKSDKNIDLLIDLAKGKEAVVIGAGPSVERQIPKLKLLYNLKKRPVMICVATASKLIVDAGIIPDYLVIVDKDVALSHPLVCNFADLKESRLVYFPLVMPEVLRAWKTERYFAYSRGKVYDEVKLIFPSGYLFSGGSVIHVATDLAVKLGCSSITFYGADFSYNSNQTHAGHLRGTLPNYQNIASPKDTKHSLKNGYGDKVNTHSSFISYLIEMEKYIKFHPEVKFWNSSKSGAFIQGCKFTQDCR